MIVCSAKFLAGFEAGRDSERDKDFRRQFAIWFLTYTAPIVREVKGADFLRWASHERLQFGPGAARSRKCSSKAFIRVQLACPT